MLLYYLAENQTESLIEHLNENVKYTVYFDDFSTITCKFELLQPFQEGFYAFRVPYEHMKAKFPNASYFITQGTGYFVDSNDEPLCYGVVNQTLVDSDYTHDLVLGVYFLENKNSMRAEMKIHIEAMTTGCDHPMAIDFYSRTQSPTFRAPAFPAISNFHSLFRSTEGANGYDVVLMNISQKFIEPKGNMVLDLSDSVDTFNASGSFMLRSRYTRMGLSLYHLKEDGIFHLTNNSSFRVPIVRRMFQYVPLRNFNGSICNTSSIISSSASINTQMMYNDPDSLYRFGECVTKTNAKRKPKC